MLLRFLDICRHTDHAEPLTVERYDADGTAYCWRFTADECVKSWFKASELRLVLASGYAQEFPPVVEA